MDIPKSERQKIVERARTMLAGDPAKAMLAREGWRRVGALIVAHATAKRPKMKVFEVHHMQETAREAFLAAMVAGEPLEECERLSRSRVGL